MSAKSARRSSIKIKPPKNSGELLIRQEVERWGAMDFAKFVEIALYHPKYGYYNQSSPQRGRAGDYFTSLQVSPIFSEVMAEAILSMKEAIGTEQFAVVEWGSGDGEFLVGLLNALTARNAMKGIRVYAVERGQPAKEKLFKKLSRFPKCQIVSSLDDIEMAGGLEGCLFSNEFFDALPFHRFRFRQGRWKEVFVSLEDGKLTELEGEPSDAALISPEKLAGLDFLEGQEIEVRPAADSWMEEWGSIFTRGYMLTLDYGHPRSMLYNPRRMNGTWMCYHQHQVNQTPFENIGRQDITSHIDFTQLVEAGRRNGLEPDLFCSQGIFLSFLGQERIQKFLSDGTELEKAKKIRAVQQLVHPDGMGEAFWVLLQSKNVPLPDNFKAIPNRLRRLI